MEEVKIKKTTVETVVGFRYLKKETSEKTEGFGNKSWILTHDILYLNGNFIKKHTVMSKSITSIEESKKGYTGDALALRGDEGRDKLR